MIDFNWRIVNAKRNSITSEIKSVDWEYYGKDFDTGTFSFKSGNAILPPGDNSVAFGDVTSDLMVEWVLASDTLISVSTMETDISATISEINSEGILLDGLPLGL